MNLLAKLPFQSFFSFPSALFSSLSPSLSPTHTGCEVTTRVEAMLQHTSITVLIYIQIRSHTLGQVAQLVCTSYIHTHSHTDTYRHTHTHTHTHTQGEKQHTGKYMGKHSVRAWEPLTHGWVRILPTESHMLQWCLKTQTHMLTHKTHKKTKVK